MTKTLSGISTTAAAGTGTWLSGLSGWPAGGGVLRRYVRGRARVILDLLIDHPGEQLEAGWLASQIAGTSAVGVPQPQLVARAFRDMQSAQAVSGRSLPVLLVARERRRCQLWHEARSRLTVPAGPRAPPARRA